MAVMTHHKKGVRASALHPTEFTFASAGSDSIRQWKCPQGTLIQKLEGHNAIVNTLSINEDNVLVSGGDNGSIQTVRVTLPDGAGGREFVRLRVTRL